MLRYLFGTHHGELPVHIVGKGGQGHQIFAAAALEGPEHTLFLGLEGTEAELQQQRATAEAVGATSLMSLDACLDPSCLGQLPPPPPINPCHLPPLDVYAFLVLRAKDPLRDELGLVIEALGKDRVALATDGSGQFLIQLAGTDRGEVESHLDRLGSLAEVVVATHWANGNEVVRA
jgi:hypothetical protein